MNFYNPYLYSIPTRATSGLFNKINFSSIINGTTKTLNLINQAIPVIKQAQPVIRNAKTMFTIMNEFKKSDTNHITNTEVTNSNNIVNDAVGEEKRIVNNNYPTFFI